MNPNLAVISLIVFPKIEDSNTKSTAIKCVSNPLLGETVKVNLPQLWKAIDRTLTKLKPALTISKQQNYTSRSSKAL
jgi:hypothetical protein